MTEDTQRFIDNGDGTITDRHTNLMWMKNDSFLDLKAFVNYESGRATAKKYLKQKNEEAFAGYTDWRFPTKREACSLMDPDHVILDSYGMNIFLNPVFPPGGGFDTWTSHARGKITAYVYSFNSGTGGHKEVDNSFNTSVRLVRQVGEVKNLPERVAPVKMDPGRGGGWR